MLHKLFCLLPLIVLLVTACTPVRQQETAAVPLVPVDFIRQGNGVIWWRSPLRVHDTQLPLAVYDSNGAPSIRIVDDFLFPTDVLIVYSAQSGEVRVFLRRSPHGGCLLLYKEEGPRFEDPCYGSRFDLTGKYISGPSPRHLDQLPATVQGNMIWVTPEILYGLPRPIAQ